jgi:hypothetical protein
MNLTMAKAPENLKKYSIESKYYLFTNKIIYV